MESLGNDDVSIVRALQVRDEDDVKQKIPKERLGTFCDIYCTVILRLTSILFCVTCYQ